eukprot:1145584-Prorocentrum_minimum.AAC.6
MEAPSAEEAEAGPELDAAIHLEFPCNRDLLQGMSLATEQYVGNLHTIDHTVCMLEGVGAEAARAQEMEFKPETVLVHVEHFYNLYMSLYTSLHLHKVLQLAIMMAHYQLHKEMVPSAVRTSMRHFFTGKEEMMTLNRDYVKEMLHAMSVRAIIKRFSCPLPTPFPFLPPSCQHEVLTPETRALTVIGPEE